MDHDLPFPHPRHCPTPAEAISHKEVIARLERAIQAAQGMDELEDHLQHLQKVKTNHVSYISPLRRLPAELLREIVYLCIQDDVKVTTLTQVCGTLRDVVIRLPSLWNKILLEPGIKSRRGKYEAKAPGFHRCRNRDHLDLLLRRAESSHLHVYIESPPVSDMLALISHYNSIITSMTIDKGFSSSAGLNKSDFETLNLELLHELKLHYIKPEDAELLMDLALQSTREMDVELMVESMTPKLLGHELLKRSIRLGILAGMNSPLASPRIQLPHVEWLRIHGPANLFEALDLGHSRIGAFCS
ncbi:hypothetical protein CPB86DRAFT_58218 [Serendipita vermifera]|nr:hypothetical protein CPB86DRAFT_58218 [Serendipita vermifera]